MNNNPETTECRNCGCTLVGKPYHLGGRAHYYRRGIRYEAKSNWYGGFVCSRRCDENDKHRSSSSCRILKDGEKLTVTT